MLNSRSHSSNDSVSSATARAFGAEITIGDHGNTLFYLVARTATPDRAVRSVGGHIVSRLASPAEALAVAPLAAHAQLRNHRDIALAGPVTVDFKRFNRFTRLIGLGRAAAPRQPSSESASRIHKPATGELK